MLRNFAILTLGFALTVNFVSCGDDEGDDKPADKGGDKIKAVDLGLSIKWEQISYLQRLEEVMIYF